MSTRIETITTEELLLVKNKRELDAIRQHHKESSALINRAEARVPNTGTELLADGKTTKYEWLVKMKNWYERSHHENIATIDRQEKLIKKLQARIEKLT